MPRQTMPRLAGIRPKLRPSATLPAMIRSSPAAEIAAVAASGSDADAIGRGAGYPTIDASGDHARHPGAIDA